MMDSNTHEVETGFNYELIKMNYFRKMVTSDSWQ